MKGYCEVTLFISGEKTLANAGTIMEKLNDLAVCVDYSTLVFRDNGLFFRGEYPNNVTAEQIEETGARIDRQAMSGADSQ